MAIKGAARSDSTGRIARCALVVAGRVVDWAFPPACAACGAGVGRDQVLGRAPVLCGVCRAGVVPIARSGDGGSEASCPICLRPGGPAVGRCPDCGGSPAYERVYAFARYEGTVRRLVLAAKFRPDPLAARALGDLVAEGLVTAGSIGADVVVPVPISRDRQRERGFNQAEVMATRIARRLHLPVACVLRRSPSLPQVGLGRTARRQNAVGGPTVRDPRPVVGRRVLLVDDVLTTGTTANRCARALLAAGARSVLVAVAGR